MELFLKRQLFSDHCSIEAKKIDPLFFWFGMFSKSHFENCRRFFAFKKRELQKSQEAQRGSNNQPLRSSEIYETSANSGSIDAFTLATVDMPFLATAAVWRIDNPCRNRRTISQCFLKN